MPVLNSTNIITEIGADALHDSKVELAFNSAIRMLESAGIVFFTSSTAKTTKQITGYSNGRYLFHTNFWQANRSTPVLRVKSKDGTSTRVLTSTEYELSLYKKNPEAVYSVELIKPISIDEVLEIEAVWGLFNYDDCPSDLYLAIQQYCLESVNSWLAMTAKTSTGGMEISSKSIGKVSYSYRSSQTSIAENALKSVTAKYSI